MVLYSSNYLIIKWCPGRDSNPHGSLRRILSPLRLPISPPGRAGREEGIKAAWMREAMMLTEGGEEKVEAEPGIEPRSTALQAAA